MASGTLVLVVGPSGAGKDTLIAGAKEELAGEADFVFVRRTVTRPAIAVVEDHESVTAAEFDLRKQHGAYALDWEAHGLRYGLPASLRDDIDAGRVVVANGSRAMLNAARSAFAGLKVLLIEATPAVRAARLAARGRESAAEIAARLAREVETAAPEAVRIDNSGAVAAGVSRFVAALRAIAAG